MSIILFSLMAGNNLKKKPYSSINYYYTYMHSTPNIHIFYLIQIIGTANRQSIVLNNTLIIHIEFMMINRNADGCLKLAY